MTRIRLMAESLVLALGARIASSAIAQQPAGVSGVLDGLAFTGPTGERGEAAQRVDEKVVFADGKLRSSVCEQMGFPPNAYRATRERDAVRFESLLVSAKDGTIRWEGVVRGGLVEAAYTWTKERLLWTSRRNSWFKGAPVRR
jgi:hypothetical protein